MKDETEVTAYRAVIKPCPIRRVMQRTMKRSGIKAYAVSHLALSGQIHMVEEKNFGDSV